MDPDGRFSLGGALVAGVCYLGAAVVIAAGTFVTVTTAGTTAVVVAPAAAELAKDLVITGTAVLAVDTVSENYAKNNEKYKLNGENNVLSKEGNKTGKVEGTFKEGSKADEESKKQSLPDMKKNPPDHPDYQPPKNWDGKKVRTGNGSGWPAKNGDVWEPTDHNGTHAPHWDVQHRNGTHTPVYPE